MTENKDKLTVSEYIQKHQLRESIEELVFECYKSQTEKPMEFMESFFRKKNGKTETQTETVKSDLVSEVFARSIIDSRGQPTVEVDVYVGGKLMGRSSAPSGASTGKNEALELRDGEDKTKFNGLGVTKAVKNVNEDINNALKGKPLDLVKMDKVMIDLDGTDKKTKLGGNAMTATSFAVATAGAQAHDEELFVYLAKQFQAFLGQSTDLKDKKFSLPRPMCNILNGGKHAGGDLQVQEFMIMPKANKPFSEMLRSVCEVYAALKKILTKKFGVSAKNVGDEGGFAVGALADPDETLTLIEEAIKECGYSDDMDLCLDCASSEFYDEEKKLYQIIKGQFITAQELVNYYEKLVERHPKLVSIEDGFSEEDYEGWKEFNARMGSKIMIVGDDLYTTNKIYIQKGIENKWANALLLKVNQIGTILESFESSKMIFEAKQNVIVSHRSGETTNSLIADLVVAIGAGYIKTGAPCRGERTCKYNRLLQIEEYLIKNNLLKQ